MHILIVDDEPKFLLVKTLLSEGHKVAEEKTPDAALNYIDRHHWTLDLVIVDEVFKNNNEFSKLTSGLELGKVVKTHHPNVPMIMFTANSDNSTTSTAALADSGYIYFYHKSSFTDVSIFKIIADIQAREIYRIKIENRLKEKDRSLLEFFEELNSGVRNTLRKESAIDDGYITIGSHKIDVFHLFEGYYTAKTLDDLKEIYDIIQDYLTRTDKETSIIFTGDWGDDESEIRNLLLEYETTPEGEKDREYIEKEAVNFLLKALSLIYYQNYDGQKDIRIDRYFKEITTTCKANDNRRHQLFLDKMIARRIFIGFEHLDEDIKKPLSMRNMIFLVKYGGTSTFEEFDKNEVQYTSYQPLPAAGNPRSLFSDLGLSFHSTLPANLTPKEGANSNAQIYHLRTSREFILREEISFCKNIVPFVRDFWHFLQDFDIPASTATKYRLEQRNFSTLEDLKAFLKKLQRVDLEDYMLIIACVSEQLPIPDVRKLVEKYLQVNF